MSLLGFLKKATVEEVQSQSKAARTNTAKQRNPNPTFLGIRLWRDGSVFPSQALVDKFDLEYRDAQVVVENLPLKDGQTTPDTKRTLEFPNGTGNGFDVIDSREWAQFKGDGNLLFIAPVAKNAGKVDLFSSVNFDEAGKPKVTVMDQGAATFGKEVLIPAVEEVYGLEFFKPEIKDEKGHVVRPTVEGPEFVDLAVVEEIEGVNIPDTFSKPIIHAPKRITRGADKGKSDYTRRENLRLYALVPVQALGDTQEQPEEGNETTGTQDHEIVDLTEATPKERAAFLNGADA